MPSNSNTFVEEGGWVETGLGFQRFQPLFEMEYSHHQISGREAVDKNLITRSQLKTINKHVGHYLGSYHVNGEPKFSFHKDQIHVHHIHIDNKHYHIQMGVSRAGKHYHHVVFQKTPDASLHGGVRYTKITQKGFDND